MPLTFKMTSPTFVWHGLYLFMQQYMTMSKHQMKVQHISLVQLEIYAIISSSIKLSLLNCKWQLGMGNTLVLLNLHLITLFGCGDCLANWSVYVSVKRLMFEWWRGNMQMFYEVNKKNIRNKKYCDNSVRKCINIAKAFVKLTFSKEAKKSSEYL